MRTYLAANVKDNNTSSRKPTSAELSQVAKTLNQPVDESHELPDIPWECEHLWRWFWDIRGGVGSNGFGPNPISHSEIQAWRGNTKIDPSPWEISALQAMNNEYMNFYAERQERRKPKSASNASTQRRRLQR